MKELIEDNKSFTIFLAIAYTFGIISSFYKIEIILSFIILVLLLLLLFLYKYNPKQIIALYLIFFAGIIRYNYSNNSTPLEGINANDAKIQGKIISAKTSVLNKKIKFYVNASKIQIFDKKIKNANSKILVSLDNFNNLNEPLKIGDEIEIKGKLRTPESATNPYQFNYKKYLENNDVKIILYGNSIKTISKAKLSPNFKDNWYYILSKFEDTREIIIKQHSKNIKSPYLEVLGGIVFGGETINPDETVKENFRNSGLLHLLAASGLNVALIFGIWWTIANFIKFPYRLSILTGALCVILYTFMTGFPPSILRAGLMLLFVLFGKLIDRDSSNVALLFFVGFLILLFNPKMFFDIGFQLSFIVTFGLIVSCPVVISKFKNVDKKFKNKYKKSKDFKKRFIYLFSPGNLISIVLVPLIAQLWVIPLQMHYFYSLAPLSIFANIAVIPFIGILSFIGFLSSIVALIPFLNNYIVFIFDLIAKPLLYLLVKISAFFAHFKFSLIPINSLNIFQMFNFWFILLFLILNIKKDFKHKKSAITLFVLVLIFILSFIKFDNLNKNLEIIMFDVQNADCFLIKTPKNKCILIDSGIKKYNGTSSGIEIINPYLKNKKIKLEKLIITHFDIDHSGGVLDILNSNKVNEIYIQNKDASNKEAFEILKYLDNNNIDYKIAKNNEKIYEEENVEIYTFKANIKNSNKNILENENSIITLLKYKNQNILFMADSGIQGYNEIKKYLPDKINILKIGHHGAQNVINQKMIEEIKPEYGLISTGQNNFNHPHFSTIELLNNNNIKTISTKNYGFVKIIIKGDKIGFYAFKGGLKLKKIKFNKEDLIPFHKTKYFQDFIKKNL